MSKTPNTNLATQIQVFLCRFMVMMTAKMGEKDSRDDLIKAFRVFDSDETGSAHLRMTR